jgi:outer membrane protein
MRLTSSLPAAALLAGMILPAAAMADDTAAQPKPTPPTAAQVAAATPAAKDSFTGKSGGDFMVRLRGIAVIPRDHSDYIDPIGGHVEQTNAYVPELDLTYFITDNFAVEAIAAITKHDGKAKNTAAGDVDLGSVWVLPPTVTLQYHPLPKEKFSPYIGAGVNYTFFFNDDTPDDGPVKSIHYSDSFGWALQAGIDYAITDSLYLNVDVKRLFVSTKASINGGDIKSKVDVDPWIVGAGLGFKF